MTDTQPIEDPEGQRAVGAGRERGRLVAMGVALLIAVVVGTFLVLQLFGGSSVDVTLRSLGTSGDDAFTAAVAPAPSGRLADFAENGFPAGADVAVGTSGAGGTGGTAGSLAQYRTVSASVPGVFGGSLSEVTCDKDQLVTFLNAEPQKARAWAAVLAMDVDDVETYVDGLTGVNLGADTRVLDHGFADGNLVARQAVLQRGTAVLVDARGVPRVDCYSGNPLRQPTISEDETFIGTPWTTFDQSEVVVIADATDDVDEFELVSVDDGTSFVRPVGTTGAADSSTVAAATDAGTDTDAEAAPTAIPTTPTPVPVTRELTVAGEIDVNAPVQGEVGSAQGELIYEFDAPAGAKLVVQVANDRASVGGIAVDLRSAGQRMEFFRVVPGGSESWPLTLSHEDGGRYEVIISEGPGAFEFVVEATPQDDAGQGRDAGAEFDDALEIEGGQTVTGHLAGLDLADAYVLELADAPLLVLTAAVERGSARATAIDLHMFGERLEFFRVNPAGDATREILFGADDALLEFYLTEGPAEYEFTAELIPQQDGGQRGDAPGELPDARELTEDSFAGRVGDRDEVDYYLFEAPADEFTISVDVSTDSERGLGVEVLGPDGVRIDFFRVQPGANGTVDIEGDQGFEGETFRLVMTEGRADYVVSIS